MVGAMTVTLRSSCHDTINAPVVVLSLSGNLGWSSNRVPEPNPQKLANHDEGVNNFRSLTHQARIIVTNSQWARPLGKRLILILTV